MHHHDDEDGMVPFRKRGQRKRYFLETRLRPSSRTYGPWSEGFREWHRYSKGYVTEAQRAQALVTLNAKDDLFEYRVEVRRDDDL